MDIRPQTQIMVLLSVILLFANIKYAFMYHDVTALFIMLNLAQYGLCTIFAFYI